MADELDEYSDLIEEVEVDAFGEENLGTDIEEELNKILNVKGLRYPSKKRLRNLPQYKNKTPEEFEADFAKLVMGVRYDREWETRILLKMKEFEKDYDLTDLKINDINNLRSLAAANLRLSDLDSVMGQLLAQGVTLNNISLIDKVGSQQNDLRKSIGMMEDTLKISRKIRKSDEENSVPAFIDDLKKKAKVFYEQKMMYIICPKCNTILATAWFLYPGVKNTIRLHCSNKLDNDEVCGCDFTVNTKELLETKMSNNVSVLPQELR